MYNEQCTLGFKRVCLILITIIPFMYNAFIQNQIFPHHQINSFMSL